MPAIGLFEAKTKLSEIVRRAESGERFTITVRGRPVAELGPAPAANAEHSQREIEAAIERLRNPRIVGPDHETIRTWIEEGRL
jgi:prevent-host-death family protein